MGTSKNHCGSFSRQADYILCLKANHPTLFEVDTWFETAREKGTLPMLTHTAEVGIIAPNP